MRPVPLDAVAVLALGCVGILLGAWLKRVCRWLDRLCIPTSIVGGLLLALGFLALHLRGLDFAPDTTLRDLCMIAFMTTIGLSANWQRIRRGGVLVLILWLLACLGAILQNLLGVGLAQLLGVDPLLGILSGSVALAGGPATAVAFGSMFESMGVHGAAETAIAAATFGIAVAGLIGGYIGKRLIAGRNPRAEGHRDPAPMLFDEAPATSGFLSLLPAVLWIGAAMGLGAILNLGFARLNLRFPVYIGAMIAAALLRNANDRWRWVALPSAAIEQCAEVSLYLFIVIAVLSLRLWDLAGLALPLLIMLVAQVALCWLLCVTACFWWMGRDYRAAIISSGYAGFMLGITANAVACMQELVEKYGPAPDAFLVIPVVGAFLIDLANTFIIAAMARVLR